jgi:hypothetical protein
LTKFDRARKHLDDLELEVARFALSEPYRVRARTEGGRGDKTFRLEFTSKAENTLIPIVAADVIYNLRSGLDHLMGSLVPPKHRRSVMFPIFWNGVWEPAVDGDNDQQKKDRERWATSTRHAPAEAVTLLKSWQPDDSTVPEHHVVRLRLLNTLSDRDRHQRLPVVTAGHQSLYARAFFPNGTHRDGIGLVKPGHMVIDQARIRLPRGAVRGECYGPVSVLLHVASLNRHVELVSYLNDMLAGVREVGDGLGPFVRRD